MEDFIKNIYIKRKGLIQKWVEDNIVIYDEAEGEILQLNKTAGMIWDYITPAYTIEDIIGIISRYFTGGDKEVKKDIIHFIRQLQRLELIQRCDGKSAI